MKKITEIYTHYKIMPPLQEHMLRVTAVASLICDNLTISVNKEDIVVACLLHDMGNLIKSNLKLFPEFLEPEGLEYWQKVKDEFIKKYGSDEHEATAKILKEIGVSDNILYLADQNRFVFLCKHRDSDDMHIKIIKYADTRVGPHGILSFEERMGESTERYKNEKYGPMNEGRSKLIACGKEIEQQIFAKCRIKPEDITDETTKSTILRLKDFVIE